MPEKNRVALIIETSSGYGRQLLEGIVRFMHAHEEWSVFVEQRDITLPPPAWLSQWDGQGIISRSTTPKFAEMVKESGIPFVDLTDRRANSEALHVWSDDAAIGRLAAEHLMERGFKHFGCCGFKSEAWSDRRRRAFVSAVSESGSACSVYDSPWHGATVQPWEQGQQELVSWVRELPKPLGVMACNDLRGQHVLEACAKTGLTVPEEVAVVGVDDDQLFCQLCDPPLSSVIPNTKVVGYRAAELLAQLMTHQVVEQREHLIEPLGVAVRQSTDVVAIDNPHVAAALIFIRKNACRGITVEEVLRQVPVSRSNLERQLRKLLKRSPQQEIRNVQLKRAQQLLTATDLSIEQIAVKCGFGHPEYLNVVFKRELKMTPGEFRRSNQS